MIGIYDSGIGGLGIWKKVHAMLPQESIWYYGDTKHFPFGDKTADEVRQIALNGLRKLAERCTIIVIACNTASVSDLDYYREELDIPIIAVVPVIKTAAAISQNRTIALMATNATQTAPYTENLISQFALGYIIEPLACSGLANIVESGEVYKNPDILKNYLSGIKNADVIVLGCTHYTLIKGLIQYYAGPDVKVIDSNGAISRQVLRVMQQHSLLNPTTEPEIIFECSGDQAAFMKQVSRYISLKHTR